jgi:D-alanyl-D-alanine carboxypeptidase
VMEPALVAEIESGLRRLGVPGCSIGVVDDTGQERLAVFGHSDLADDRAVTPDTVFHLFSATKLYTTTALMLLVERELVDLDDPVSAHLPHIELAHPVTLRQLASHNSGLRDTLRAFLSVHIPGEDAPSSAEALARYRLGRAKPPGETVAYRNVNYAILGEAIAKVAGVSYEEFVSGSVLDPLGSPAAFDYTDEMRAAAATGYLARFDPMRLVLRALFPRSSGRLFGGSSRGLVALNEYALDTAAIGGLVGCVSDFLPLIREFLSPNDGVLTAASKTQMLTIQAQGKAGITSTLGVGLGWKAGQANGAAFWNHEGGGAGFTSETRIYPDQGIGMVILMNRSHTPSLSRLAHEICETIRQRTS